MAVYTTGLTITARGGSWYFDELPIRADTVSVTQFCTEKGWTLSSYTADSMRYSNDGGRLMNFYGVETVAGVTGMTWLNLFGYDSIVTSITTS